MVKSWHLIGLDKQTDYSTVSMNKQNKASADFAREHTKKYVTEQKRKDNAVLCRSEEASFLGFHGGEKQDITDSRAVG